MFGNVFQGKRIIVTGHTGFKGSWLSLWLHELGAEVTGLALPPHTDPSHFDLIGLKDIVNHIEADIRDPEVVNKAFEIAKPEIVFHLAAQAVVRDSYEDPKRTFDTNIGGTVNVLEALRISTSVKAAIVVTSDKCYQNREWVWGYRENDPMGGHDPYSASKGATELVCAAYRRSFFAEGGRGRHISLSTVRAGNVIGGGDWAKDRLIPDCVRALSKGKPVVIRNPKATRPWQHVLEPLSGCLFLASRLLEDGDRFSSAWNFGPSDIGHTTVGELSERFVSGWGQGTIELMSLDESAPHENRMLRLSIDKAAFELGWFPILNGSTTIDWTIDWYKAWYRGNEDLGKLSLSQIRAYTDLASKKSALWVV